MNAMITPGGREGTKRRLCHPIWGTGKKKTDAGNRKPKTDSRTAWWPMSHAYSARFSAVLRIRAPEHFTDAIDRAADKRVQSRSDYVRAAVLDRLRADGVEIERGVA